MRGRPERYAAKILTETVHYEPPCEPDLTDEGIAAQLAHCVAPPSPEQYPAIRALVLAAIGPATQTQAAQLLHTDRGWTPWPACSRLLGLTGGTK